MAFKTVEHWRGYAKILRLMAQDAPTGAEWDDVAARALQAAYELGLADRGPALQTSAEMKS